jgi:hypothetical protein
MTAFVPFGIVFDKSQVAGEENRVDELLISHPGKALGMSFIVPQSTALNILI